MHPNYFVGADQSWVKMGLPTVMQTSTGPAPGTQIGVVLFIVAVAVVVLETFFGVEITGRVTGAIRRIAAMLPVPSAGSSGGGIREMLTMRATLAAAFALGVLAVASGRIVSLPHGSAVQLLVVMELVAVYLVLREFGAFSVPIYMIVTVATVVVALSALGEPVIASLSMSPVFPILAIGALYLGYKAIQAWRASNTTKVTIRGSQK